MLTRDGVVAWARRRHALDDAEERVEEGAHSFVIHLAPAGWQGGSTALIFKRTGDYWLVGTNQNFHDLTNATSEEEWREEASTLADLDRPDGTLAPSVTREQLMAWLAERAGWQQLDDRVTDLGWMFLVNSQPDEFLDGTGPQDPTAGPIVVVKGSGAVWWLSFSPNLGRALGAASAREFHEEMSRATYPLPAQPNEWLIPWPELPRPSREATRERVAEWLADKYGWRHLDDRISDVGWAFSVDTQPDAYLDGDESAMTYGNGPIMIVKHSGAVWHLSSNPEMIAVFSARHEDEFYKLMRAVSPVFDRTRPDGWLHV